MKTKFYLLAITVLFLVSCSTKKAALAINSTQTPKEMVLTAELMAGKTLYENRCVKCHQLYSPKEFTQEDWKPILIKMQKKAHLDDTQIASISNYISSQL